METGSNNAGEKTINYLQADFRGWSFRDLLTSQRRNTEGSETGMEESTPRSRKGKAVKGGIGPQDVGAKPSDDPKAEFHSWSLRDLLGSRRDSVDGSETSSDTSNSRHKKSRRVKHGEASGNSSPQPASPIAEALMKPVKVLLTPSATFSRLTEEREEVSKQTPSPKEFTLRDGVTLPLIGEVKWQVLKEQAKIWLQNPKNLALLVWVIAVAVSGAILFMVLVGMLDEVIPKKSDRDTWYEVSNQILNALFTLMVLYVHPTRILHMVWLIRWRPKDIIKLRDVYCKGGLRKPNEWFHMLVVLLLLHLNCFAQYALCGLNWGYKRANRPAIGVGITLATSFGAAAAAGIYNSVSPLGKDFVAEDKVPDRLDEDETEADKTERGQATRHPSIFHLQENYKLLEKRMSFASRDGRPVENPQWDGGLFDCYKEPTITLFSITCLACVFGWNLDRMGFGNRYVHVATFLLLCSAPCLVFNVAAVNVSNRNVRHGLAATGAVLSVFGLLYGGFWRIRMRERYNLPSKTWCCGQPGLTDCIQWLFCAPCSLCQEVRTSEAYDIRDDKFYLKTRVNTPGDSPEHVSEDGIDMMPAPSSSIQPLPISSMVPIKDSELVAVNPADETIFSPPPTQILDHNLELEAHNQSIL
jgi:Cys-rich protein (TIGR01571 family)